MDRQGLVVILISILLCLTATILIALRLYTFFCVVNRKGGQALLWTIVAWVRYMPLLK
jgi:hypothetical protein